MDEKKADFLVAVALQRETLWESREAVIMHFENFRDFATWDREYQAAYLQGVLVQNEEGSTVLAYHPRIEASLYSGKILCLSDAELACLQCAVSFHTAIHSQLCAMSLFLEMVESHTHIYRLAEPMQNATRRTDGARGARGEPGEDPRGARAVGAV